MRSPLALAIALAGCATEYDVIPEPPDVDPGEVTECDFTRVEGTDFYSYDCNPVFTTSGEDWANAIGSTTFNVTEVLGHPFYQLWYIGAPNAEVLGDYALGYAVSDDGTTWTPYGNNPVLEGPAAPQDWSFSGMQGMQVLWDPTAMHYLLLYGGYNVNTSEWKLGVATSPDGKAWTLSASNPVFDLVRPPPGDVVGFCWPLGLSLGTVGGYKGYVAGYDRADGPCAIYSLSSADGETWTMDESLVLDAGRPDTWNDQGYINTSVTNLGDTWYMFYVGFGDWENFGTYKSSKNMYLGWATAEGSPTNWTNQLDPIPLHQTPEGEVGAVAAHRVGDRIHLWVSDSWDGESGIGYFLYDPNRAAEEGSDTAE
jgi:hypothetical protein